MPHMSNLPWLQSYLFILLLIFISMALMFFNSLFKMNLKKKMNKNYNSFPWKW